MKPAAKLIRDRMQSQGWERNESQGEEARPTVRWVVKRFEAISGEEARIGARKEKEAMSAAK